MAEAVLGGRYRIVRHLARGGMAELYLGHDELLDRPVAVKVLFTELAEDPSFVERFRREARSAAILNHPNIVSVYDFGEAPEGYFIVMEYVAGQPLSEIIAAGAMAPAAAVAIAADVAAALAAAHGEGIIHRDVKPANVLIAAGVTKVADFGIAQAVETQDRLTLPGAVMGTAIYLSPEQAQGLAVDQRSDIYSLGLVLFQMLTGQPAFSGDTPVALAYKQKHEPPPAPSTMNPAVPGQLDALVAKALAVDPAARPQTAEAFRAALLAIGSRPADVATAELELPPTSALPVAGALGRSAAPAAPVPAPEAPTAAFPPAPGPPPVAPAGNRAGGGPPGATAVPPLRPSGTSGARPVSRYRRRRMAALALLLVLIAGAAAAVAALSHRGPAKATVPAVIGLAVADATAKVNQAGLKPQVVEQNRPGAAGRVAGQQPSAGARVNASSDVSLFVPASTTSTTRPVTRPTIRATTTTTQAAATTTRPPTTTPATTTLPATTLPSATTIPVPAT